MQDLFTKVNIYIMIFCLFHRIVIFTTKLTDFDNFNFLHIKIIFLSVQCAKNGICRFIVSRLIYGLLSHYYNIIIGIFPKYLQKKKNQQHLPA